MTQDPNPATGAFLDRLEAKLPPGTLRAAEDHHRAEPRKQLRGTAQAVVAPGTVAEVQTVIRACAAARVGVIPFGGWTGLVGGQLSPGVPALALSTHRLAAVRGFWPDEGTVTAEAGVILSDLHKLAEDAGLLFPLSLGSKGSARIGGLLSTNAGGTGVLRYGAMRDLTLGLEAVLPDGSLMDTAHRLRKSNMGYDLRNLLIGAEGTLGVITAATLRLFPQPTVIAAAVLAIRDPAAALALLARLRARVGDQVTGCELIDGTGLRWLAQSHPDTRQPFATPPDWSVLIEVSGTAPDLHDTLEEVAGTAMEDGLVSDGVFARSEAQRAAFWEARETIPEANRWVGAIASHDVSVPLSELSGLIADGRPALRRITPDLRFNIFGHVGDGNLHYNLFPAKGRDRAEYADLKDDLSACLHDLVTARGGAISAEHGIGRLRAAEFARLGDPAAIVAMRAIKQALDPQGILNPGALLMAERR